MDSITGCSAKTRLLITNGTEILLRVQAGTLSLPSGVPADSGITVSKSEQFTFSTHGCTCTAYDAPTGFSPPPGHVMKGLREAYPSMDTAEYIAASKGSELLHWNRTSRFCSKCGSPLRRHSEISKLCDACGHEYFPQLTPAIIVLVRKGREALLVHAKTFSRPFFGLVAGFVETGESLEQCVAREVMEETSLEIKNIKYHSSQSWPFPATLMLGFTADYAGGELRFADGELSNGGFFSPDDLPPLTSPPSIARRMIDDWLSETDNLARSQPS